MLRHKLRLAALAALCLLPGACGKRGPAQSAAADVQALLTAIHARDPDAFEARLDRAALRTDLREQIIGVGRANGVEVEGGPSDSALDRRIDIDAFRLVAQASGAPLAAPPSPAQTAGLIRAIDPDHVCVHELTPSQPCVLTFAREKAGWRLVGMPAQPDVAIAVGPEPARK